MWNVVIKQSTLVQILNKTLTNRLQLAWKTLRVCYKKDSYKKHEADNSSG